MRCRSGQGRVGMKALDGPFPPQSLPESGRQDLGPVSPGLVTGRSRASRGAAGCIPPAETFHTNLPFAASVATG